MKLKLIEEATIVVSLYNIPDTPFNLEILSVNHPRPNHLRALEDTISFLYSVHQNSPSFRAALCCFLQNIGNDYEYISLKLRSK